MKMPNSPEDYTEGNGCGPKWIPRRIKTLLFDWFFEAECNRHDYWHSVGGSERDRWRYDFTFLVEMLGAASRVSVACMLLAFPMAFLFYLLVVTGGWAGFKYRG